MINNKMLEQIRETGAADGLYIMGVLSMIANFGALYKNKIKDYSKKEHKSYVELSVAMALMDQAVKEMSDFIIAIDSLCNGE